MTADMSSEPQPLDLFDDAAWSLGHFSDEETPIGSALLREKTSAGLSAWDILGIAEQAMSTISTNEHLDAIRRV